MDETEGVIKNPLLSNFIRDETREERLDSSLLLKKSVTHSNALWGFEVHKT
jgi:hypothetical protein